MDLKDLLGESVSSLAVCGDFSSSFAGISRPIRVLFCEIEFHSKMALIENLFSKRRKRLKRKSCKDEEARPRNEENAI